jgi:hypothetical protein
MFHELSPQNKLWILTFKRQPCSYFLFLTKIVWLKVVHPLKIYQYTKFDGPTLTGASFASIHLRSLNVHHFGMVEATELKSTASKSPSMAWPPYWISNLPIGSKVIGGGGGGETTDGQTDRQTGDLISLTFLFEESRLKRYKIGWVLYNTQKDKSNWNLVCQW